MQTALASRSTFRPSEPASVAGLLPADSIPFRDDWMPELICKGERVSGGQRVAAAEGSSSGGQQRRAGAQVRAHRHPSGAC